MKLLISFSHDEKHKDFVASFHTDRKWLQTILESLVLEDYQVNVCKYYGPLTEAQTPVSTFSDMCMLTQTISL